MLKARSALIALATVTLGTTFVAAVPASAAAGRTEPLTRSWHVSFRVTGPNFPEFSAVTAVSATSAWAFDLVGGKAPGAYQFNGSTWKRHAFPAKNGDAVFAASSSSSSNVWAFTFKGQVLRFNGSTWAKVRKFSRAIGSGVAISKTNVWVFGSPGPAALGTWHFNGSGWTKSSSGRGLNGASALSANSIWAYGGTSVAHWNGHTWSKTSVASLLPKNTQLSHSFLAGIYAHSSSSVYAVGSGGRQDEGGPLVLLHFNGSKWSRVGPIKNTGGPVALIPDGQGGLWIPVQTGAPGQGTMEHFFHGKFSTVTLPITPPHLALLGAAIGRHTTAALAVGFSRKSFSSTTTTAVNLRFGS